MFKVEDPPIRQGHKHRVNQNISEKVSHLWHCYKPGGGGYNSVMAMRNLPDIKEELELTYFDVSTPVSLIVKKLREKSIDSRFFYQREVPVNAIIGWREDKIVLKGPQLGRVEPDEKDAIEIIGAIQKSDVFLANSIKDPKYFEIYLDTSRKFNVPVYSVITTSLEPDFVFEKVFTDPNTAIILNYDEIPYLFSESTEKMSEEEKINFAFDALKRKIKSKINLNKPTYITLGKNGVYYSKNESITHIRLKPEYSEKVRDSIIKEGGNFNGAGDVFSAAVVAYDLATNAEAEETALKASIAAIRHIGYKGELSSDSFECTKYSIH